MTFAMTELDVVRWGEARRIIQNGKAIGQAMKTLEETGELIAALAKNDKEEAIDAVGDVMVTLTMICAILDINLVDCYKHAYEQIKDRKGYLRPDGVFVKEVKNTQLAVV